MDTNSYFTIRTITLFILSYGMGYTLPNQKKREVQNPTTKWLYQKMLGVIVIRFNPHTPQENIVMSNIDETRQKIIRLFGKYACKIYSIHSE